MEGNVDLTVDANHIPNNLSSFKYKSSFITNRNGVKIAVPLKYLNLYLFCSDTKLYVFIATLSTGDNVKLSKLLGEEFKRPIYWNKYKVISNKTYNVNGYIRELLDSSYQGIKRLFVLAQDNANGITPNSHKRYFLPRIKIKNYNSEIDGRNFYDQAINDSIKQYDEVRKVSTGQGDD